MNDKILVGYDPNSYKYEDYKRFIEELNDNNSELIELYSISKVKGESIVDLDSSKVKLFSTTSQIISFLSQKKIRIYISDDKSLIDDINESIPLLSSKSKIIGCQGIFVDNEAISKYYIEKDYIKQFNFWTKYLFKYM